MVTASEFAQECVFRGLYFGVNAHYLLGVAKLRSDLKDDSDGERIGPFRLTQAQWNANSNDLGFGLKYLPGQITSWRRQCGVLGFMTYKAQNALRLNQQEFPSALELYETEFGQAADQQKLFDAFKKALDDTAALIRPAAEAVLDDPSQVDDPLDNVDAPTKTKLPSFGGGLFDTKAPRIMRQLMDDFAFTKVQTAGILGNLGHETGGFRHFQEIAPAAGVGGLGWAQWTGMTQNPPGRRRSFLAFCTANGVSPISDEGNYGFLRHELITSEKATVPALKATNTLEDATRVFEEEFERAGIVSLTSRIKFGHRAFAAFESQSPA